MLPTRIFVILATVLSALMPIRASALNADQEHILMVAAMLAVADRWCADYRVDKQLVAGVIAEMGIDLDEPTVSKALKKQRQNFEAAMGRSGERAYCERLYQQFGPSGPINKDGDTVFMMKR